MTKTPQEWKEECAYCAGLVATRGNADVPRELVESYAAWDAASDAAWDAAWDAASDAVITQERDR